MLAQLKKTYGSDVNFLSLTIEDNDNAATVKEWLHRNHADSLVAARAARPAMQQLHRMAGVEPVAIPAVMFVDKDGHVSNGLVAPFSEEQLKSAVKELAGK